MEWLCFYIFRESFFKLILVILKKKKYIGNNYMSLKESRDDEKNRVTYSYSMPNDY